MQWKRYSYIIRRWLWLLLLAAFMSAAIGWAFAASTNRNGPAVFLFLGVAAVAGFVWALVGVFGIEYVTDNIRVPGDVERLTSVPLLGVVPAARRGSRSFLQTPGTEASSVYRTAGMKIIPQTNYPVRGRAILVCSPQETVLAAEAAANLGMSCARLGYPTLLIDADRMGGQLTKALNLEGVPGFMDALSNSSSDIMLHLMPSVPNMYVLPSGAAPAVEPVTFSIPYLRNLVERSGAEGSMIMLAGPPAGPSALMAAGLAKSVHDVVLVAVQDETKRRTLRRSVQTLQQSGAHLAGILLMERPASYAYDDLPAPVRTVNSTVYEHETYLHNGSMPEDEEAVPDYEASERSSWFSGIPDEDDSRPIAGGEQDAQTLEQEEEAPVYTHEAAAREDTRRSALAHPGEPVLDFSSLDAQTSISELREQPPESIDLSGLDDLAGSPEHFETATQDSIDLSSLDSLGGELAEQAPTRHRISPLLSSSEPAVTMPVAGPVEEAAREEASAPAAASEEPVVSYPVPGMTPDRELHEESPLQSEVEAPPAPIPGFWIAGEPALPTLEDEPPAREPEPEPESAPEPAADWENYSEEELALQSLADLAPPLTTPAQTAAASRSYAPPQPVAPQQEPEADRRIVSVPNSADEAPSMAAPGAPAVSLPSVGSRLAIVVAKWIAAIRSARELRTSTPPEPRRKRTAPSQPAGERLRLQAAHVVRAIAARRYNKARSAGSSPQAFSSTQPSAEAAPALAPQSPVAAGEASGDGGTIDSWLRDAEQAHARGDNRHARELVNRVLDRDPHNEEAWHLRLQLAQPSANPPAPVPVRIAPPPRRSSRLLAPLIGGAAVILVGLGLYTAWPQISSFSGALTAPTGPGGTARASSPTPGVETGYDVSGAFLTFWGANGGAKLLGNPISPRIQETEENGSTLEVQYFERARLEMHPEIADANARVTLGRLGAEVPVSGTLSNPLPAGLQGDTVTFKETGFEVPRKFYDFWTQNNGAVLFGFPLTPVLNDVTLDGKPVVVQYFERARMEYHPESAGTPDEIQLTNLGTRVYALKHPR